MPLKYLLCLSGMLISLSSAGDISMGLLARIVVPSCALTVTYPGVHNSLAWDVGMIHSANGKAMLTETEPQLMREIELNFSNPVSGAFSLIDGQPVDCGMINTGVEITFIPQDLGADNAVDCPVQPGASYCGVIPQHDELGRNFLYLVTLPDSRLQPMLSESNMKITFPNPPPRYLGDAVMQMNGESNKAVIIEKKDETQQGSVSLGRLPFRIRLVKDYPTAQFAPSIPGNDIGSTSSITITATYF